jgi:hypothetical protein
VQRETFLRQPQPARAALDEPHAQALFELRDAP